MVLSLLDLLIIPKEFGEIPFDIFSQTGNRHDIQFAVRVEVFSGFEQDDIQELFPGIRGQIGCNDIKLDLG